MNPKISVIICTYNRAPFLAKAINSVLTQNFNSFELIIVDDASTDTTAEILEEYFENPKVRIQKNDVNMGISKSRNIGIGLSLGEYIAMLDSDDEWIDREKLKKQFEYLENNPEYVLIGSNIKIVDEFGNFIKNTDYKTEDSDIRNKILKFNQFAQSTVMFKKESEKKTGNYDKKLSCVEDLDFFLRLGLIGKFKNLADITTSYTKHSGGTSYTKKLNMAWNNYIIVIKNFGKYPNWLIGVTIAKLRFLKNLF